MNDAPMPKSTDEQLPTAGTPESGDGQSPEPAATTSTAEAGTEPGSTEAGDTASKPATKASSAKKASPTKRAPAKKPATAKKSTATKPAAKKSAATQDAGAPTKKAAAKPAAKKATTKTTTAKKTTAAKKAAAKKTAPPTKTPAQPAPTGGAKGAARGGRDFDIVIYGATGFVGQLIAKYLAANAPAGVSIALAGRSQQKLRAVRDQLPGAQDWPLIIASTEDSASLDAMAASTKVVLTTVGPYLLHGLPVVEACAKHGTHYTDLTGEVLFMRRSIDGFNGVARDSGARIVHSCGFDSIPSDLGVFALHQAATADADGTLGETRLGVQSLRGGFSGGTVASMLAGLDAIEEDPSLGKIAGDPYGLSPDRSAEPSPGDGNWAGVGYDRILNSWVSPFIMALVNTRVVRRSNALLGYAYSKDFRYQEMTMNGRGPGGLLSATALTAGLAAGYGALNFGPTRQLAERLLPSPGEGPDEEARENGFFSVRLASKTLDGRRYQGLVAAQGDPGYAATAVMISQCALALALDESLLPDRAGVLTPATALGQPVIDRLRGAGMTLHAYRI